MQRIYFMPAITEIVRNRLTKHPKYDSLYAGASFHVADFGAEPWFLVVADVDASQHAAISGQADVTTIPIAALDDPVGPSQTSAIQARLEAANIPAGWVQEGQTYREVLRVLLRICQTMQAIQGQLGLTGSLFTGGVSLATRMDELSPAIRQKLRDAGTQLNMDTSWVTGATTIRQLLKNCADRWAYGTIYLLGVEF